MDWISKSNTSVVDGDWKIAGLGVEMDKDWAF